MKHFVTSSHLYYLDKTKENPTMYDVLSKAKNELQNEVKRLAMTLSNTETFSGLIALEPKLDQIKERLTLLKYLENSTTMVQFFQEDASKKSSLVNSSEITTHIPEAFPKTNTKWPHYRPIQIDLNDKVAFVRELFVGNQAAFDQMMSDLNQSDSLEGAEQQIKKWTSEHHQAEKSSYLERLINLVKQRFNG